MSLDDVGGFRTFGLFATGALFTDRVDAGRRLARHLDHLRGQDVVVVALPRGGVPVAAEIARRLQAPLDVILVRKLGVPGQAELAMGAVGQDGIRVLNRAVIRSCAVTPDEVASVVVATLAATDRAGEVVPDRDDPGQARGDGGHARDDEVSVPSGDVELQGHLTVPPHAIGVVVFAHGSGSSRHSPRNRQVAQVLNRAGFVTLLFDLLTPGEASCRGNVFDIPLLAARLATATRWLHCQPGLARLPVGWFGASTGAAAALWAAAEPDAVAAAVVSRGGRPDLAGRRLAAVRAPTLLIVGSADTDVLALNRHALSQLHCRSHLTLVPGATHLFEEPGALKAVAEVALAWFQEQMPTVQQVAEQWSRPRGRTCPHAATGSDLDP